MTPRSAASPRYSRSRVPLSPPPAQPDAVRQLPRKAERYRERKRCLWSSPPVPHTSSSGSSIFACYLVLPAIGKGQRLCLAHFSSGKAARLGLIPGRSRDTEIPLVTMVPVLGSALVLVFVSGASGRAEIRQPRSAEPSEGAELNLTCSLGSVITETIVWYQRLPNRGPRYIVSGYQGIFNSINPEGALHIPEDRKSSTLSLRRARLADAAVYYCALSDTV
ncbi:uncharacterized protein LOC115642315 isoform X1 [Gopherus evgoodei]|uniref:Uncharacterized LOC115642315 n=1 Tax=Gopherus evgoodei TaxID=1825980 RepID=A0A8C4Y888_9SAUR|nr:uncharacterized protein LOC115642315 isoform X1 [Gopherus evgoodei]